MLGLFATLNLGTRALQSQQTGVEIAGQNLANINNPGYARQRIDLQTSPAITTGIGPQGSGVQVIGIQQIRDAFLDGQVRDETSVGGYWEAQQGGLGNAQTALNEFLNQSASSVNGAADAGSAATSQGLSVQLTQLFSAFQSVAANPTSLAERQALVNQAQTLAGTFNQISTRLSAVNDGLNESVSNDVASANKLLSQIAELNKEIADAESPGGGRANDLRDMRQQKLEGLAKLVDFQAASAPDGTVSISIGGTALVSGRQVIDSLQTYDGGSGQLLARAATAGTPLTLAGGSISGAIGARDGALADLRSGLDSLASQLVTQVNSVYSTGYDLNGNTGATFFSGTDAATIGVSGSLQNDPAQVQAAGTAGVAGDNTVALALAQMVNAKQARLNNQTFDGAYGHLVMNLGNALSNANDQMANHDSVNALLLNRRDSVSGVSMEEEMSSLISFQKAYQAAARIVSTVDQMLDELLNMKR
jgi:flagellar hook-associated protein 1 FlgK